jgi:hypothetical protein
MAAGVVCMIAISAEEVFTLRSGSFKRNVWGLSGLADTGCAEAKIRVWIGRCLLCILLGEVLRTGIRHFIAGWLETWAQVSVGLATGRLLSSDRGHCYFNSLGWAWISAFAC